MEWEFSVIMWVKLNLECFIVKTKSEDMIKWYCIKDIKIVKN